MRQGTNEIGEFGTFQLGGDRSLEFHLNSIPVPKADGAPPPAPMPDCVAFTLSHPLPLDMLLDDTNVVEFIPPQIDGALVWAEMFFI